MTALFVSTYFAQTYGSEIEAVASELGVQFDLILLPADPTQKLPAEDCERAEITFFSGDIVPTYQRTYFGAATRAPNLRWMHVFNAGVDSPVFNTLLANGVRISTSSGSTAKPIAQTAIGGMLMLARRFPQWGESQRRHEWNQIPSPAAPPDLDGQTIVVVGVGAIGNEIARLARAIGLYVIGVRRSPQRDGDHVDEMVKPAALASVLPRANWLALACPLTDDTRGLIDAASLNLLPGGAHILNIARGEVIDESAMIRALQSGHLAGAYLDVFATEPLPAESPLWDMPNVIVTPHNSAAAKGNEGRAVQYFFRNLRAYMKDEPLENE
ncbi:MAG: D-2-hydroxyacid dehydrogenase, partial [Tepidiformaceae bacterium]